MMHYDGHHNRIDRIVRPLETEIMERENFSEGLFSGTTSPLTKLMKMFLIYQNGEACIACPLTFSRLTVGLSSAAVMTRAACEAKQYAAFRDAFSIPIGQFPMAAGQLREMDVTAKRTTAGAFKLYSGFLAVGGKPTGGLGAGEPAGAREQRFNIRELIMLQKITASWDGTDVIRDAMSIFRGNGVMEDFSSLPGLYRDSAVNELWEGPRNVLLMQIHRDFQRASSWYRPSMFVTAILKGADSRITAELGKEMDELVAYPNLLQMDDRTIAACDRWDDFYHRLYHAYQDQALAEVEGKK